MDEIKIRLKKIIYDSIAIYAGDYVKNVSDMYDSLAFSIAGELGKNISIDEFVDDLKDLNLYRYVEVKEDDLKKVAADNFIIKSIKDNREYAEDLLELDNVDLNRPKKHDIREVVEKVIPQIVSIIDKPLEIKIRKFVEECLKDSGIFAELLEEEKKIISEEIKKKNNKKNIRFCKEMKSLLEIYNEDVFLENLVVDVSNKIKNSKIIFIKDFPHEFRDKLNLKECIDDSAKELKVSKEDIKDHFVQSDSYKSFTGDDDNCDDMLEFMDDYFELDDESFNEYYNIPSYRKKRSRKVPK